MKKLSPSASCQTAGVERSIDRLLQVLADVPLGFSITAVNIIYALYVNLTSSRNSRQVSGGDLVICLDNHHYMM